MGAGAVLGSEGEGLARIGAMATCRVLAVTSLREIERLRSSNSHLQWSKLPLHLGVRPPRPAGAVATQTPERESPTNSFGVRRR